MDEDDPDGIDNAIDLGAYSSDADGDGLTYSITSQSNPGLAAASIDGNYLDIVAPAQDQSGTNMVCVKANDGTDGSNEECFTITVYAVVNIPAGVSIFSLPLISASGFVAFKDLGSNCNVLSNGVNDLAYIDSGTSDPLSNNYTWNYLGLGDSLYPGQGYFINVESACSFTMNGNLEQVTPQDIGYLGTRKIKPGWNTIGAPSTRVDFQDVKGTCHSPITLNNGEVVGGPLLFTYGTNCTGVPGYKPGGYEQCGSWYCYCETDTLLPGNGYLLVSDWLNQDCQLG